MSTVTAVARIIILSLAGAGVLVFVTQRRLTFPGTFRSPVRSTATAPRAVEQIWIETRFGRVESWHFAAPDTPDTPGRRPAIIFAHGNGELIDDWAHEMSRLALEGVNVLAVEFPGYGFSDGSPTRSTIRETFERAFDVVSTRDDVDPERIVAYGRSLGGGAAADLAIMRPVAALVLQSTFSSTMAVARRMLVPGFLVRDRFDNVAAVRRFDGPILLMHGRADDVVPFLHAERLAAAREGLQITPLPCGHNDCGGAWPEISARIVDFLRDSGILPERVSG